MGLVCFYVAFGGRELNEALLRRVNESGKEFLIHSVVDGVHFLRLAIGGLEVDAWHIENVVTVLSKALTEAVGENPKWQELQRENFALVSWLFRTFEVILFFALITLPCFGHSLPIVIMVERRTCSMQVTALYDYEPEQNDELSFQEGDVLRVMLVQDDGWWSGYNVESPNVVGLFPSNYVQALRTASQVQSTKSLVDAGTTPRPPASSRQRIQQQPRQESDTPELEDDEEVDKVKELRSEYRGHVGAVLQLRRNLEQAERVSEAVRYARQQAERDRLRHRKSWREREQDEEEDIDEQVVEASHNGDEDDTEDEDEAAFPQLQGDMHETDRQEADKGSNIMMKNKAQTDEELDRATQTTADTENAAATVIARVYRRHAAIIQTNSEREREVEQQKIRVIAAVHIQRWAAHAYSRQRKQKTARRRWQRENDAATNIQKWIRMRWACFWRRRVEIERTMREAQQARHLVEIMKVQQLQAEGEEKMRREAENEHRLVKEKEERQQLEQKAKQEEEQHRVLQQKLEDEQQKLRQLQLKAVEEEVHRRFIQAKGQDADDPAAPSQAPSPGKTRRKVMKKEAVDLIKTLVQQQLGETLRDHDAKMDELQRMVARLQTMKQQEQKLPMPPRSSDASSGSFLPRITVQSSVPRQPIAPSGLRAPRPVMLSKLPVVASYGEEMVESNSRALPRFADFSSAIADS
ncbi:hypothetical protein PC122_g22162 [Phytophthora cactorum]|nr:hypothetical protein PC122_g22162 [Phytophthora cactorum]